LTAIKVLYNVASCWLNVKEYINDARYHERKKYLHSYARTHARTAKLIVNIRLRVHVKVYFKVRRRQGTGLFCFRIGTVPVSGCWELSSDRHIGLHEMQGISWLVEQVLSCQVCTVSG
jgi:hypothetical protein